MPFDGTRMRILFTGATSLAGSAFFSRLRERGHDATGISRWAAGPGLRRADLEAPVPALPDADFDALVHFAAFVPRRESESLWPECFARNVESMGRLLAWADGRVRRVVLASSCAVYGTRKVYTPTDERHPLRPDTAYALSKYAQEELAEAFCRSRRLPLVVLRLGYVYGAGMPASRLASSLVQKVLDGEPVRLTNARVAGLHLIHPDDIARMGELLLTEGHGVYNLVSARHISLWEYVATAMEVLGRRTEVTTEDSAEAVVTNHYSCRRLEELHAIRPEVTLRQGIARLAASLSSSSGAETPS